MRGCGKSRKNYSKRDAPRESASQAVFDGVNTKKASKKINYDALQGAFGGDGSFKLPTQVVVDPSLNVYSSNTRNVKPQIDKTSASTTYPFAPFGTSANRAVQGLDKKVPGVTLGPGPSGPRKTFLMSESSSSSSSSSSSKVEDEKDKSDKKGKKDDIPVRAGVVAGGTGKETVPEDNEKMDEEDMLMYEENGDNEDDYDDDEEY